MRKLIKLIFTPFFSGVLYGFYFFGIGVALLMVEVPEIYVAIYAVVMAIIGMIIDHKWRG